MFNVYFRISPLVAEGEVVVMRPRDGEYFVIASKQLTTNQVLAAINQFCERERNR